MTIENTDNNEVTLTQLFEEGLHATDDDPTDVEDMEIDFDELGPTEYHRYSQAKRMKFILSVEQGCENKLDDLTAGKQTNYLSALKDLEDQALARAKHELDIKKYELEVKKYELAKQKLQLESDMSKTDQAIAQTIMQYAIAENKRRTAEHIQQDLQQAAISLPEPVLVPGQLEQGDRIENYDQFSHRTGLVSQD